jgi:hypothetical protein
MCDCLNAIMNLSTNSENQVSMPACIASATGYLSFHPMAQCGVHALKGLACRARVTPASSPASHCCLALQAVLSAHVAFAPRARLRQAFSRTLRSQKHNIFQWV